jgi:FkbM family methyltransferase
MKKVTETLKRYFCRFKGYAALHLNDRTLAPRFHVSTNIEAEKILKKDNERELLETFLQEIRPGDIVLDIGANIGLYTLPSAFKLQGNGYVFAFEPVPIWFKRLQENIELNELSNSNLLVPYNIGFSNKNKTCDMIIKEVQGSGMGSISPNYQKHLDTDKVISIPVRLVQGDQFLREQGIPHPNLVKIDVEGAELAVLQGLEKSLRHEDCRLILCEVHPKFMDEPPGNVEKILQDYGFCCEISKERRSEYHILAKKDLH